VVRFLRVIRAVYSIRQQELAKRSGVSVREIARVEAGEAMPSRGFMDAIEKAFTEILVERELRDRKEVAK
jgi:transcriptional regulator with XRE-family HTH domain